MKRLKSLTIALILTFSVLTSAFAADVSGYEAHATIDLTPFKSDKYEGTFDDIAYTATISTSDEISMEMKTDYYSTSFDFIPRIKMGTISGIEVFSPELYFETRQYSSIGAFYCVIGENRYLLPASTITNNSFFMSGTIKIDLNVYRLLEEITSTSFPVKFAVASRTDAIATLTSNDIELLKQFVIDIKSSGLLDQLIADDDSLIIITQYNREVKSGSILD